jgi:hypothetical protein
VGGGRRGGSDLRPAVALHAVLVVRVTSLHHGLLGTAATGHLPDHAAARRRDDLLGAGGELQAGDAVVGVVGDDEAVVAGGAGEGAAVTGFLQAHNTQVGQRNE